MSANTAAAPAAPAKSKKMIVILAVVVLLIVGGGAAAWLLLANRHQGDEEGNAPKQSQNNSPKTPPTFLPMENMVVNLADPGGDRFAQIGITLELADAKTETLVKQYLPSIRSGILLLVSQRTTEELLVREGKEKLALDIRREVSKPLGFVVPNPRKRPVARDPDDEEDEDVPRPRADNNPVRQVLFSSFIIQ